MRLEQWLTASLILAASACWSSPQYAQPDPADWVEDAVPAAPAFSKNNIILLEMPKYVSVKVGVDPDTVTVGGDGVVRYVVVVINATGSTYATYEGIRCTTDEVKTYARYSASGQWQAVSEPKWQDLNGNQPVKYAFALARQGACENHLSTSKPDVLRALRQTTKPIPGSGRNSFQ